jgi:hypothetical protein
MVNFLHRVATERVSDPPLNYVTTRLGGPAYIALEVEPIASMDMGLIDQQCDKLVEKVSSMDEKTEET